MNNLNQLRTRYTNIFFTTLKKNYSKQVKEKIIIPRRIERSPTDILKALATTIKLDPTAAHYKYHDDPYFIPASHIGKRTFSLAKEAGRKAAQWIKQEHPDLFQHRSADPPIQCFFPKPTYNEESDVSEEILNQVIDSTFVSDSITVYKLLLAKGIEPSYETKLKLLQLVCFYNSKDPPSEDFLEERWFQQSTNVKERTKNTWDDHGFAEDLFSSIKENADSRAYCTLFLGRIRHFQIEKGWSLYKEILDKGLELNLDCYNALLFITNYVNEDSEIRLKHIQDILTLMNKNKIRPNILTLNSTLDSLSSLGILKIARPYAEELIAEFRKLGIEPSLASYHHLLNLFYKDRSFSTTETMEAILNQIENQEFIIQDPKDTRFFLTAMTVCRYHLQSNEFAHRIHKLLRVRNNYKFIGNSLSESIYYRHLFIILCNTEPLDKFMEFYDYHVPNIYIPEPSIMEELLKIVEINGDPKPFGRLWSDIVLFDHINRPSVVEAFANAMSTVHLEPESQGLINFCTIISNIMDKYKKDQADKLKKNRFSLTGKMISQMLKIVLRIDEKFEQAKEILYILINKQDEILMHGPVESDALQMLIEKAVANKDIQVAMDCVKLCVENGYHNVNDYVKYLKESGCLNSSEMDKLDTLMKL